MTARGDAGVPFTATLRASGVLALGDGPAPRRTFRVQWLDAWEALRVEASADASIASVAGAALAAWHAPGPADAYEVKLRGALVADLTASLAAAGVTDGATLTIASRARRVLR